MKLNNHAMTESFVWQGQSDDDFRTCVQNLDDIVTYLSSLKDSEYIYYSSTIYEQKVLQGTTIADCYSPTEDDALYDEKQFLMRTIATMMTQDEDECGRHEHQVDIYFYPLQCRERKTNYASNLKEYLASRRNILTELKSSDEFCAFMGTCFPDIIFSDSIERGFRSISDFSIYDVRMAIVHDLGILNDEALDLYREYYPDTNKMCQALGAKVLACSMDKPKNNKYLFFPFSYIGDAESAQVKVILCSPHTKLIRRDSDLRIYFAWKDADIGDNKKILVGHIGGHPY